MWLDLTMCVMSPQNSTVTVTAMLPQTSCLSMPRFFQTTLWQPARRVLFPCSRTSKLPLMATFSGSAIKLQSPCGCCRRNVSNAPLAPGDRLAWSLIKTCRMMQCVARISPNKWSCVCLCHFCLCCFRFWFCCGSIGPSHLPRWTLRPPCLCKVIQRNPAQDPRSIRSRGSLWNQSIRVWVG